MEKLSGRICDTFGQCLALGLLLAPLNHGARPHKAPAYVAHHDRQQHGHQAPALCVLDDDDGCRRRRHQPDGSRRRITRPAVAAAFAEGGIEPEHVLLQ